MCMWAQYLSKYAVYISSFIILCVAAIETEIVLKNFYDNGYSYYTHLIAAYFITFNLIGNLYFCYRKASHVVDSPAWKPLQNMNEPTNWNYCEKCKILAPPRSWHCNICQNCILKRDHHCLLIGRCVGHNNYRYFLVFLVYAVIAVFYAGYLNVVYVFWCNSHFFDKFLAKLCVFNPPLYILKYLWDGEFVEFGWQYVLMPVFSALFFSGVVANILLFEHSRRFLIGATYYEARSTRYNLGSWTRNLEMVLGRRYVLVWFVPFLGSELPHDGVNWEQQFIEQKTT